MVKPDTVAKMQPSRGINPAGFEPFRQQVILFIHKRIAVRPNPGTFNPQLQQGKEFQRIVVISANHGLFVTRIRPVVPITLSRDP